MLIYHCISVIRDVEERNRELDQVLLNYTSLVKPAFEEFCLPVILSQYSYYDFKY